MNDRRRTNKVSHLATSSVSRLVLCGLFAMAVAGCSSKAKPAGAGGASGFGGTGGGSINDGAVGTGGGPAIDGGGIVDLGAAESCGALAGPSANQSVDPSGCTDTNACAPGLLCGGLNCDQAWLCFSHDDDLLEHPCPADVAEYCGCDGVTFNALNTCPDRPYEYWGACQDGVNCDREDLRCALAEPSCPEGMVASVVKENYGPCVPIARCRCEFVWECPQRDKYTCDPAGHRCGPKAPPDAGQDASEESDAARRSSGVDPSKRIDALTSDELKTLCDYMASFYGGYGMAVQCGLGLNLLNEDSDQAICLANWLTPCAVSVGQVERCANDRTCDTPSPISCEAVRPCRK
jgi:hypothetical protein